MCKAMNIEVGNSAIGSSIHKDSPSILVIAIVEFSSLVHSRKSIAFALVFSVKLKHTYFVGCGMT